MFVLTIERVAPGPMEAETPETTAKSKRRERSCDIANRSETKKGYWSKGQLGVRFLCPVLGDDIELKVTNFAGASPLKSVRCQDYQATTPEINPHIWRVLAYRMTMD
jgi:hypothetical protein